MTASKAEPFDGPTFVYRFYDASDVLLYVGITMAPHTRWKVHGQRSWWARVRRVAADWYPTRSAALAEERRAIREEQPEFNIKDAVVKPRQALPVVECRPAPGRTFLRVGQAAELLTVSASTVRRFERDGYLQGHRLPGSKHRRYDRAAVERLLAESLGADHPEDSAPPARG